MYYAPDKLAMLILKSFLAMMIISIIVSVSNVAPMYLQLNSLANDIVLRGAVNNYVLEDNVIEAVNNAFVKNDIYSKLVYTGEKTQGPAGRPAGIQVYARVTDAGTSGSAFNKGGGYKTGEYHPAFDSNNRKVIVKEGSGWDPKTKVDDTMKFRGPGGYNGAQRGDRVTVRVETKMKGMIFAFGMQFPFEIPLAVEKSAPAMHYYRI